MNKTARPWISAILAVSVVLLTLVFVACGESEEAQVDVPTPAATGETSSATTPTADTADRTPGSASSAATPAAELPSISGVSLDEYLMAVCGGQEELAAWEEDVSLRELSSGLEQHIGILESLEPPAEVSDWHDAGLAFQRAFKRTVDDYLEDPGDQSEDEFLFSMFFTLASAFEPIEQAIAGMDPERDPGWLKPDASTRKHRNLSLSKSSERTYPWEVAYRARWTSLMKSATSSSKRTEDRST